MGLGAPWHVMEHGIPDQGSNLHLLHWQVDSLPLSHQGSLGCGDFHLILFRPDFARGLICEEEIVLSLLKGDMEKMNVNRVPVLMTIQTHQDTSIIEQYTVSGTTRLLNF